MVSNADELKADIKRNLGFVNFSTEQQIDRLHVCLSFYWSYVIVNFSEELNLYFYYLKAMMIKTNNLLEVLGVPESHRVLPHLESPLLQEDLRDRVGLKDHAFPVLPEDLPHLCLQPTDD